MTQLSQLAEFNLNRLLKLANELEITKDQIVQIVANEGKYYLIYEETI